MSWLTTLPASVYILAFVVACIAVYALDAWLDRQPWRLDDQGRDYFPFFREEGKRWGGPR